MNRMSSNFPLKQLIQNSTRKTRISETMIDHVFVSNEESIIATKVAKIALSDHYPTVIVRKPLS